MKKILKLIILSLFVILLVIISNFIKNSIIINNINIRADEIFSANNLYIKVETKQNSEKIILNEIYCKENIILIKTYENNVLKTKDWKDTYTGKTKSYMYLSDQIIETDSFNDELLKTIKGTTNLDKSVFCFIQKSDNYYVFDENNVFNKYYNIDTYTLEKMDNIENSIETSYTFKFNTVTDSDVEMPSENKSIEI